MFDTYEKGLLTLLVTTAIGTLYFTAGSGLDILTFGQTTLDLPGLFMFIGSLLLAVGLIAYFVSLTVYIVDAVR